MQVLISVFQRATVLQVPDEQGGLLSFATQMKPFDDQYKITVTNSRTKGELHMSKSITSWITDEGVVREDLFAADVLALVDPSRKRE